MPDNLDWPPEHRFAMRVVNAVLDNVLAIGSVYATVGLGYAGENVVFFEQVGRHVLRALDRPFVLGGDFSMSAETLSASGWLSAVRAKVMHAPSSDPTYVDGRGHGTAIDFFVVSDDLVPFVNKVWVAEGPACIRGHRPVSIAISSLRLDTYTLRRRKPKFHPAL